MKWEIPARVKTGIIVIICNLLTMTSIHTTKFILEKREDDMRHLNKMITDSRDSASTVLIMGHFSEPHKLLLKNYQILDYEYEGVPFSIIDEEADNLSNLLYEINGDFERILSKDQLEENDYAFLEEYCKLMTSFSAQLDQQIEASRNATWSNLIPRDRLYIALNNTEQVFSNTAYPILFSRYQDTHEPFDLNSKALFTPKPDMTETTLLKLNQEQLFRRKLAMDLARRIFENYSVFRELDFDVKERSLNVAELTLEKQTTHFKYNITIDPNLDQIAIDLSSWSAGEASDKNFALRSMNDILQLLPLYASDHMMILQDEDNIRYSIFPMQNEWYRRDYEIQIGFTEYGILEYLTITGRLNDLEQLLSGTHKSQEKPLFTTPSAEDLKALPDYNQWIRDPSLIQKYYQIVDKNKQPQIRYEYTYQDKPFAITLDAETGNELSHFEIGRYYRPYSEPIPMKSFLGK